MAPSDVATENVRLGFWLRMARERSGKSQAGAAEYLGFSEKSKSTVSDYENGVTPPSLKTLRRLAGWYGVPLRTFTEPEKTAFERLDELARGATEVARADRAAEGASDLEDDDLPDEPRHRRSA